MAATAPGLKCGCDQSAADCGSLVLLDEELSQTVLVAPGIWGMLPGRREAWSNLQFGKSAPQKSTLPKLEIPTTMLLMVAQPTDDY